MSRFHLSLALALTMPPVARADDSSAADKRADRRAERRALKKIVNTEFSWDDGKQTSQQVIWYAGDGGVALYNNQKLCVAPPVQAAMTESLTAALKAAELDVDGSVTKSATVVDLNLSDRTQEIRAAGYVLCEARANSNISEAQYAALLETLFESAFADTSSAAETTTTAETSTETKTEDAANGANASETKENKKPTSGSPSAPAKDK